MSRLNIVESIPLTDENYRWYPDAIWGMYDLLRYLKGENQDRLAIDAVTNLLANSLKEYARVFRSSNEAAGRLVDKGFIDNRLHAMQYLEPTHHPEQMHQPVEMPGIYSVGVCGLIQAGKGTVGAILEHDYSAMHFQFVDSLIAFSYVLGFRPDSDRATKREVNDILKPRFGNAIFAESTIRRGARMARMKNPPMVSFDGFRSAEEADLFLSFPKSILLAVTSPIEQRYVRARNKKGQEPKSFEDFKYNSDLEERTMMGAAIPKASVTFENKGSVDDLKLALRKYFYPIIWGDEYPSSQE